MSDPDDTDTDLGEDTESKARAKSYSLGETIKVKAGAEVTRPDGSRHTMGGTTYVLDVPGTHEVAGTEYKVKAGR
jgi:hypothetical protein